MIVKIIIWLILSVTCGIAYHVAGKGGFPNAKLIRRLGCSLLALWLFLAFRGFTLRLWWAYLAFLILNYGALTLYHDYLAPDGTSENWLCWLATGATYGLAAFPLIWCGVHWYLIIARSIFLAISIMWLRERTGKVFAEEFFSGLLFCGSIPLFLI